MRRGIRLGFGAALLLGCMAGGAIGALQPGGYEDRRHIVGGWLVEDVAEQDGGRLVRLSRAKDGFRIQYFAAFWWGNEGRIQGTLVERSDCTNGHEIGRNVIAEASAVRVMLAADLAGCAVPPRRIAAAMLGFERAYALALLWARAAEEATGAEAAAIAEHGNQPDAVNDMSASPDG